MSFSVPGLRRFTNSLGSVGTFHPILLSSFGRADDVLSTFSAHVAATPHLWRL